MHITVYCPGCRTRYQLHAEMRGQQMRCPNTICRRVFEVTAEDDSPPAQERVAPAAGSMSQLEGSFAAGSVGDMVPMLAAEAVQEVPESLLDEPVPEASSPHLQDLVPLLPAEAVDDAVAEETPAWQESPSVQQLVSEPAVELPLTPEPPAEEEPPSPPRQAPETLRAPSDQPLELPPGTWEPPPVRQGAAEPAAPTPPAPEEATTRRGKRRRARWAIAGLLLALAGLLGTGVWFAFRVSEETEDQLYQQARDDFDHDKYLTATGRFRKLATTFPDSPRLGEYEFFLELCEVRSQAEGVGRNLDDALKQLNDVVNARANDLWLQQHQQPIWETYRRLAWSLAARSRRLLDPPANPEQARKVRERAGEAFAELKKFASPETDPRAHEQIAGLLGEVDQAIRRSEQLANLLRQLRQLQPTPADIDAAEQTAQAAGFFDHAEVRDLLDKLRARLVESVRYEPAPPDGIPPVRPAEDSEPSLLVVPRLDEPAAPRPGNGVVFALARGVIHALAEANGRVLWATRVGIDSSTLPVRVPATVATPELALVLSSDTHTLTARDVFTGQPRWVYPLEARCPGPPLLVDQRAYVPTVNGTIHELDVATGRLLGQFHLSALLSVGGVRESGSTRLYFAAERRYLYVIDVDPAQRHRPCVAIVQTHHPSGSLRGAPVIPGGDDVPALTTGSLYLVLSQATGFDTMKLRVVRLPITPTGTASPQPEVSIRGWSWFPAYGDSEKLALITDAGVLGLFGMNQPHNDDPPLFPLLPSEFVVGADPGGRPQLVHAADCDFWVLCRGRLQRFQLAIGRQEGLKLGKVWGDALSLGSPLHAGQVNARRDTLFVVTQNAARQTCLATAVDTATGEVRWQRQLGVLSQGQPLLLGGKVLLRDHGGALFQFDPDRQPNRADVEWQLGGQVVDGASDADLNHRPGSWVMAADGKTVYEIAGQGTQLLVRRFEPGKKPSRQRYQLPSPLAGTVGLGAGGLVLPLADGSLCRQSLSGGKPEGGPHWRAVHADPDARGHAVHLRGDEFVVTDGSRGLLRVNWPTGKLWQRKEFTLPMRRIVAAPLVLPAAKGETEPRICVADAEGTLALLQGDSFKVVRRWQLSGPITASPFLRGTHIAALVERRRLVWIDPAQDAPVWTYDTGGEAIVGQPQLVGDMLVVATESGRFIGVDPARGQPLGPGYTLEANVAPVAAPVAFGRDRTFAPLTDGTMLLLSLKQLRKSGDRSPHPPPTNTPPRKPGS